VRTPNPCAAMKIIVGLGNPGLRYRSTRHNIGFMVVQAVAQQRGVRLHRGRFKCSRGDGRIGKERVVLARPQAFMNRSGPCVAGLVGSLGCPLSDLLVISDDANLDLGKLRIRRGGSAGGHNGLDSVIQHLGTEDFPRLRLGVGRPPDGIDMMTYVLAAFRRSEWPVVHEAVARAAQAVETWVYHGVEEAMNRFN